jgi:hypothetical protein
MSDQLPGIPDGYEAVRFGMVEDQEQYIDIDGNVYIWDKDRQSSCQYLIVRKIPPKVRTVKVAEFAVWHSDSDSVAVITMSAAPAKNRRRSGAHTRRISDWREIEILEEDQ